MKRMFTVMLVGVCGIVNAFQPDTTLVNQKTDEINKVAEIWRTTLLDDTMICRMYCPSAHERPVYLHHGNFPPGSEFDFISAKEDDVLGPYVNGNSISIYKYIGRVPMPDSVRFSQILVAWYGSVGAQPYVVRSKEAARARADSLCYELRVGRIFMDEVMIAESDDVVGMIFNHGNYGWMTRDSKYPQHVIDAAFNQTAGSFVIAESERGFHVIYVEELSLVWETYSAWEIVWAIDPCYNLKGQAITSEAIYPGGYDAMELYFNSEKTKYDSLDVAGQFDFPVLVFFDVLEDGSTANVEILFQYWITPGIAIDLTHLIRSMPKWYPAQTCNGPVREGQAVIIYL